MKVRLGIGFVVLAVAVGALPATASGAASDAPGAGDPDPTFAAGGIQIRGAARANVASAVLDTAGDLVVCGSVDADGFVGRFRADGTPDPGFAGGDLARVDLGGQTAILDCAARLDGSVDAVVNTDGPSAVRVLRLRADGLPDDSFGVDGIATLPGRRGSRVVVDGDGVLVAFDGAAAPSPARAGLVRLDSSGAVDASFASAGTAWLTVPATAGTPFVTDAARSPDGSVVVAVMANSGRLGRLLPVGGLREYGDGWTTVDLPVASAAGIAFDALGRVLVASPQDAALVRVLASDGIDPLFPGAPAGISPVRVAVDGSGRIYVGSRTGLDLARLLADGGLDGTFGTAGVADVGGTTPYDYIAEVVLDASGRPHVAATFGTIVDSTGFVARYLSAGANPTPVRRTWVGPDAGVWSEPANWSPPGPPLDGDTLVLPGSACCSGTVTVFDLPALTVAALEFPSGDFHVQATNAPFVGSLTVTGGITAATAVIASVDARVVLPAGAHEVHRSLQANVTLRASGPGSITATGPGRIGLADDVPPYAGVVELLEGELGAPPGIPSVPTIVSGGTRWDQPGAEAIVLRSGSTSGASFGAPSTGPVTVSAGEVVLARADLRGVVSGPGRIVVAGPVALAGPASAWTGGVRIADGGTLTVDGPDALGAGPVAVAAGGHATFTTSEVTTAGAVTSAGRLTLPGYWNPWVTPTLRTGSLTLGATSTLRVGIADPPHAAASDRIAVTGAVTVGGRLEVDAGPLAPGTTVTLVANDGADPVAGAFATADGTALHEGATVATTRGPDLAISYVGGDGNDVTLTAAAPVPPPPPPPVTPDPVVPPPVAPPPPVTPGPDTGQPDPVSGYWMVTAAGEVFAFGSVPALGSWDSTADVVDVEPSPSGLGYWLLDARGSVAAFGDATTLPSSALPGFDRGERAAALSATPSGLGLWVFTTWGRVLPVGDAPHLGDMVATPLSGPVLDAVPTPTGRGYWMVGSDGGIFAFGDAAFHGSMGAHVLNAPVQSLVPSASGLGYWLVASDGGIFAFGDAPFRGSMGATPLNRPVTGMVRYGDGYLMVGEDGGIFSFSDSPFVGSLGDRPPAHAVTAVAAA